MNVLDGCSVGVSDTAACHIPVYPAISKWNSTTYIRDCLWSTTACPAVECHLQITERNAVSAIYCRQNWYFMLKKIHPRKHEVVNEDEVVNWHLSDANSLPHRLVSPNQYNSSLLSQCPGKQMPTLKHLQCENKYHLCTLMVQSSKWTNPSTF